MGRGRKGRLGVGGGLRGGVEGGERSSHGEPWGVRDFLKGAME